MKKNIKCEILANINFNQIGTKPKLNSIGMPDMSCFGLKYDSIYWNRGK
tara:strand:- start:800 stop:946 length:147 start_codon:yes stop_codon:yes gene_type:complete